jgi:hypothetical protein
LEEKAENLLLSKWVVLVLVFQLEEGPSAAVLLKQVEVIL